MTIREIQNQVTVITEYKHEWALAHTLEDRLFKSVLIAIASGHDNAQALALEAIKSCALDFQRKTTN